MNRFAHAGPAEVIAHRGFSAQAPENTLAALSAAITAKADAVEFDLQMTSEGVPLLFHDDTLERTTDGSGAVRAHTVEEIRALDAGSWFSEAFAGEPVPELGDALDLLLPWHGRIYPELKGVDSARDVDRIVDEVARRGLLERTVFIAMDWSLLDRVRVSAPRAGIGYIVRKARQTEDAIGRAQQDRWALLDFERSIPVRDRSAAARAAALRIPMAAWTVDDPADANRLLDVGVSRITTNQVARMVAWKAGLLTSG
ncbi:MAG: glycerophosphodiester phosphodiesterase family protein [Gemmatimonadota bacterium]